MEAACLGSNVPKSIKPATPLETHASILNDLAVDLGSQAARLARLLERLSGPEPTAVEAGQSARPEPQSGIIHVSQFAAQRIRNEVNEIADLIGRLENIA